MYSPCSPNGIRIQIFSGLAQYTNLPMIRPNRNESNQGKKCGARANESAQMCMSIECAVNVWMRLNNRNNLCVNAEIYFHTIHHAVTTTPLFYFEWISSVFIFWQIDFCEINVFELLQKNISFVASLSTVSLLEASLIAIWCRIIFELQFVIELHYLKTRLFKHDLSSGVPFDFHTSFRFHFPKACAHAHTHTSHGIFMRFVDYLKGNRCILLANINYLMSTFE